MATAYTIECTVQLCRKGPGGRGALRAGHRPALRPALRPAPRTERLPRLARLMALALRFEKLIATGVVKDFRTLARLGHVSSARVSQILSLLHLAPDIQEALLFHSCPERGRDNLGLRNVLPLTKVWEWHKQRQMWRGFADSGLARSQRGPRLAMRIPPVT
jgi:hypothetical protein